MKKLSCCLLFLVAILLSVKSNAQVSSRNGDYYPVKDTMRILYVFSEVPDDTVTFNHPNWPPGEMPIDPEGYLDAELDTSNMFGFLTKYF